MAQTNKQKGDSAEKIAVMHLLANGYEILRANYRTRTGEIDIIAQKNDIISFVEVKYRSGDSYGQPAEAVTKEKMRRIVSAATVYITESGLTERNFSFDIIEVRGRGLLSVNHIKDAFTLDNIL